MFLVDDVVLEVFYVLLLHVHPSFQFELSGGCYFSEFSQFLGEEVVYVSGAYVGYFYLYVLQELQAVSHVGQVEHVAVVEIYHQQAVSPYLLFYLLVS